MADQRMQPHAFQEESRKKPEKQRMNSRKVGLFKKNTKPDQTKSPSGGCNLKLPALEALLSAHASFGKQKRLIKGVRIP